MNFFKEVHINIDSGFGADPPDPLLHRLDTQVHVRRARERQHSTNSKFRLCLTAHLGRSGHVLPVARGQTRA